MKTTAFLAIDPQNDFCDIAGDRVPAGAALPALPVPGADADMSRAAALLEELGPAVASAWVTLDTHQRRDIAHPAFWRTRAGAQVAPFTPITFDAYRAGDFVTASADDAAIARAYLKDLESAGRYSLMVWPTHCIAGTWGHAVHARLADALAAWQRISGRPSVHVTKGENPYTEHYSPFRAEVPIDGAPETQFNVALVAQLMRHDTILVVGEALSHCVRAGVEDLAAAGDPRRIVLITDCMSPVAGFESQAADFVRRMTALGVRTMTAREAADTFKE